MFYALGALMQQTITALILAAFRGLKAMLILPVIYPLWQARCPGCRTYIHIRSTRCSCGASDLELVNAGLIGIPKALYWGLLTAVPGGIVGIIIAAVVVTVAGASHEAANFIFTGVAGICALAGATVGLYLGSKRFRITSPR